MPRKPKITKHKGVYEKVADSGIWWIRYTKDGKRVTESIGRQSDAVTIYDQRMLEIRTGKVLGVERRGVKFSALVEDALLFSKDHHRDARNFKQRLELAEGEFGARAANSITPQELRDWLTEMSDDRSWSSATSNRVKAAISKTYALGMQAQKVQTNPARLVPRKRENPGRIRYITADEEKRLRQVIAHKRPHCMYQLDLALHTGMRSGEQFSVSWDQVDFDQEYIYLSMTKNGSERYVHLNTNALQSLRDLKVECERRGLTHPTLFFDKFNTAIKSPREWFEKSCIEAGIEGVTWHITRHTYCSRLIMAGVDLKTAQELMGHKTIAMTARYAHLSPTHLKSAIRKLETPQATA